MGSSLKKKNDFLEGPWTKSGVIIAALSIIITLLGIKIGYDTYTFQISSSDKKQPIIVNKIEPITVKPSSTDEANHKKILDKIDSIRIQNQFSNSNVKNNNSQIVIEKSHKNSDKGKIIIESYNSLGKKTEIIIEDIGNNDSKKLINNSKIASTADENMSRTNIFIHYIGDCNLSVKIKIGDRVLATRGSGVIEMPRVLLGNQPFEIVGNIYCYDGRCEAYGKGFINIMRYSNYYILWDIIDYGECSIWLSD